MASSVEKGQKGDVFVATVLSVICASRTGGVKKSVDVLDAEQRDWKEQVLSAAVDRFELLKWMFLFRVSQLAAMSAVMSFLLRPA